MLSDTRFPHQLAKTINDFWQSQPGKEPVQYPYQPFVQFLNDHPTCGGYRHWGYTSLSHFLRDAQAVGLVWLRPGAVLAPGGKPFWEIAAAEKKDIYNPCHVLYWLALGFSQEEAEVYNRLVNKKDWSDEIVGKLARNSPMFDEKLHATWYYDRAGENSWSGRLERWKIAEHHATEPDNNASASTHDVSIGQKEAVKAHYTSDSSSVCF